MKENKSLFSLSQGDSENYKSVAAWFLGPKGENNDLLCKMAQQIIEEHSNFRANHYLKEDEPYITGQLPTT